MGCLVITMGAVLKPQKQVRHPNIPNKLSTRKNSAAKTESIPVCMYFDQAQLPRDVWEVAESVELGDEEVEAAVGRAPWAAAFLASPRLADKTRCVLCYI